MLTGPDGLKREESTLGDFIKTSKNVHLNDILRRCAKRIVAVDNTDPTAGEDLWKQLNEFVNGMISGLPSSEKAYYSLEMLRKSNEALRDSRQRRFSHSTAGTGAPETQS